MKNFRKIISLLLVVCMLAGITACKKNKTPTPQPSGDVTNTPTSSAGDVTGTPDVSGTPISGTPISGTPVNPTSGPGIINTSGSGSKTGNFELTGTKKLPADGIGTPGVDFEVPKTGQVTGWSDEEKADMPVFNPFGDRNLYTSYSVNNDEYESNTIEYYAEDGYTPCRIKVYGKHYSLESSNEGVTKNWILYKAKELGATIYKTDEKNVFFTYVDKNDIAWFVACEIRYETVVYDEYAMLLLKPGKEIQVMGDPIQTHNERYMFCTQKAPGKQLGATLRFDGTSDDIDDGVEVSYEAVFKCGEYSYDAGHTFTSYSAILGPRTAEEIVLDYIPAEPEWVFWFVHDGKFSGNYNAYISLAETGTITEIKLGEQPGFVKVIGASADFGATFRPYASISAGSLDAGHLEGGYRDDQGNYCYIAPAGYYQLEIGADAFCDFDYYIQNVPVSAGKITEITIPSETKAYGADLLQIGRDEEAVVGNMDIQYVVDNGDTVTMGVLVHDPQERDLFPEVKDFVITENGTQGEVVSVERQAGDGLNVIMCVDTSGSIKNSIAKVIESAVKFVESLPDDTNISIIEFKGKLTEHKGNTKAEAIKALKSMKASGYTKLYDAVACALDKLEGKKNAYVIAFTDGIDNREPEDYNPSQGSVISKEELYGRISESSATVLSMGFGPKVISSIMTNMAEASRGGEYFYVADDKALDGAFAKVRAKFGNQFTVTYKRPVIMEDQASDVPVVSIMMDISGSMNMLPEESDSDVDIRIEKVRGLFHDFIMNLPDKTIGQFASFTTYELGGELIKTRQILTQDRADMLKALSQEQAEGGTPIQKALGISYNSLRNVTSSKKVLVFFTDAALAVTDDGSGAQKEAFDKILDSINKAGIRVLFAGLGGAEYAADHEEAFRYAAEKAGGDYVIGTTVEEIEGKLKELLTKIDTPVAVEKGVNIYAALSCKAEDGSFMDYASSYTADEMVVKKQKGTVKVPGVVSKKIAGDYITYSGDTSALIYGSDTKDETVIDTRITFEDAKTSNQFADLSVSEAFIMSKFRGVEVRYQNFLALNVTLTFHKKDAKAQEEGYQIPNIFNHFYVSLNNGRMMPASEATWLAETPFAIPGECSVQVNELKDAKGNKLEIGESISGILVFLVDVETTWEQLSIHCYDVNYGHLEIPLVGALPAGLMNISELPTAAPANIADSFKLTLTGKEDTHTISGAQLEPDYLSEKVYNNDFRVLEMKFDSKVQALLDINPVDRFYYNIQTNSGNLITKMSDIVYNLPLGFTGGTKFAPGSVTQVRLPYVLPTKMLDSKATLWGEIAEGSFEMPINSGKAWDGGSDNKRYENEYFTLVVNKFAFADDWKSTAILDFTVIDKKDGEGTGGFDTMLYLFRNTDEYADVNDISESPNGGTMIDAMSRMGLGNFGDMSRLMEPAGIRMADLEATQKLIFGASDANADWGAYDGQSRRGILIFSIPSDDHKDDWKLCAECLPDLSLKISTKYFGESPLLAKKAICDIDLSYQEELENKIDAVVAAYRATHPATGTTEKIGLTDDELIGNHIEAPYLTIYGTQQIEAVKSLNDALKLMQSIVWLPGNYYPTYSPEAIITQGYAYDSDFYGLATMLFMKLGYKTGPKSVVLTDAGRENLARFAGVATNEVVNEWVYAISYTDEKGVTKIYVPAFRHYLDDLGGLVTLEYSAPNEPRKTSGQIVVKAYGELTGSAGMAAQNLALTQFADIFGGGDGEVNYYEDVILLCEEFDVKTVGKNPVDVSFISLGKDTDGVHEKITAVADTAAGLLKSGDRWVSTGDYKFDRIEVEVTVEGFSRAAVHTYLLEEDDNLLDVFMSIGINLPELTTEAVKAYEKAVNESVKAFEKIDKTNYGVCRWTTHAALAKMQRALTEYDEEACKRLGVVSIYNFDHPSVICATLKADGENAIASFDLTHITRDVILTKETEESGKSREDIGNAYHLAYSMMASQGEGDVFADGVSYLDVWATLPADAAIINIDYTTEEREKALEMFKELNAAPYLLERIEKAPYGIAFVVSTAPGKVNGKDRWAWLEIDTDNMETISVFDTGERGMAAYIVGLTPKGMAEFVVGAFIGIACSNVAVAAYALESDNFEYVMESARALMGYTLANLKAFRGAVSDAKSIYENPAKYLEGKYDDLINQAAGADIMKWYNAYRDNDASALGKEPNFCDGFEAAMKMYFGEELDWGY